MERNRFNMPLADEIRLRIKSLRINRGYAVLGLRKWSPELYTRKIHRYQMLLVQLTGEPTSRPQNTQPRDDDDWSL